MDMGELGAYRFIQRGEVMIGAMMPLMEGMPVSMWSYYIGVDDIDRALAAVRANGGTAPGEPREIPGGEYAMNGIDPQGAAFGLGEIGKAEGREGGGRDVENRVGER